MGRRLAAVAALSGLGLAQPVLSIFGDSPEFFVSGGYGGALVRWFALAVVVVPLVIGATAVVAAELVHPRAGDAVFWAVAGVLAAVVVARVARSVGVDGTVPWLLLVAAGGVGVVVAQARWRPVRLFLTYLALGNLLYLGLFLFASRSAAYIAADGSDPDVGRVEMTDAESPVVLVVFDELPLASLLAADGTINESRYPNFARLASMSTWYRNTAARQSKTPRAVPEILTGTRSSPNALPTAQSYPRNLFSLLGPDRPVYGLEVATDMCPPQYCTPRNAPIGQAFEDAAIVFGHKVLPTPVAADLPAIDTGYGGFVDANAGGAVEGTVDGATGPSTPANPYDLWRARPLSERAGAGQRVAFRDVVSALDGSPAAHLVHVALPHSPWALTPYGEVRNSVIPGADQPGDPHGEVRLRLAFQMHSLQLGATDALLGELLDHLEGSGTLDETLLVVTSDHGTSFTRPDVGRRLTKRNAEELLRVPLFVKAVRQDRGIVDDRPAQTVDVLPTIADHLGARSGWELDGRSLLADDRPDADRLVADGVGPLLELARERAAWVSDDGWRGLAAVGRYGDLVGRPLSALEVSDLPAGAIEFEQASDFRSLPTEGNKMPFVLTGRVQADVRPDHALVAVNGVIAGVLDGFYEVDGGWYFYGFVTDEYVDGTNDVRAFRVGDGGRLHPFERPEGEALNAG